MGYGSVRHIYLLATDREIPLLGRALQRRGILPLQYVPRQQFLDQACHLAEGSSATGCWRGSILSQDRE